MTTSDREIDRPGPGPRNRPDRLAPAATTAGGRAPAPRRRATIEDVASAAGVSVATVSRALRSLPNVAISTRERVNAVAAELDYRPDPAASRLAAGRTRTVTLGIPSLNGWYFSTVVAGAEAVCTESGYDVQVICIPSYADLDRLLDRSHRLERRTDGLVLVDISLDPGRAADLATRGVSLATIGTAVPGYPAIQIDDEEVGRIAARHLVDIGHERIGVIGGLPDDPMDFVVPRLRRRGVEDELATHGLELDDRHVANGNFGMTGGGEAMSELLDLDDPPTAFFAMSDEMAFGALMALRERGLVAGSGPGQVPLMGVDDHEFARVVRLTTIRQPVAEHGARAARLLIEGMHPHDAGHDGATPVRGTVPERVVLELVVRETTSPH